MIDLTSINEALGLAAGAVGLTEKAASTVATVKGMLDGSKPKDNGEAARLLNMLASDLTAANMLNMQLSVSLKILSQELHRREAFDSKKARYHLTKTPAGEVLWQLVSEKAGDDPIHFVCPVCMENERISILQGDEYTVECIPCKHWYKIRDMNLDPGAFA